MAGRLAVFFGALALGLISLPMHTFAQCYVYFPNYIAVNSPFSTRWTSDCVVRDEVLSPLPPVISPG